MARMRVRLTFPPERIQEPIIYHLVKDFDIVIRDSAAAKVSPTWDVRVDIFGTTHQPGKE